MWIELNTDNNNLEETLVLKAIEIAGHKPAFSCIFMFNGKIFCVNRLPAYTQIYVRLNQ